MALNIQACIVGLYFAFSHEPCEGMPETSHGGEGKPVQLKLDVSPCWDAELNLSNPEFSPSGFPAISSDGRFFVSFDSGIAEPQFIRITEIKTAKTIEKLSLELPAKLGPAESWWCFDKNDSKKSKLFSRVKNHYRNIMRRVNNMNHWRTLAPVSIEQYRVNASDPSKGSIRIVCSNEITLEVSRDSHGPALLAYPSAAVLMARDENGPYMKQINSQKRKIPFRFVSSPCKSEPLCERVADVEAYSSKYRIAVLAEWYSDVRCRSKCDDLTEYNFVPVPNHPD